MWDKSRESTVWSTVNLLNSVVLTVALIAGAASAQQLTVGAGSSLSLSDNALDLGCSVLVVAGTLNADSAAIARVLNVDIASGATFNGGSGTLDVTGDWDRAGTFNAGTGKVRVVDGCGTTSSTISGGNSFYDLELSTTTGKLVVFEAGTTTTVAGMFAVSGVSGNLLEIVSTSSGNEAFLDLNQAEVGNYVSVKDNHAINGPVMLGENSTIAGNASGWSLSSTVPGLSLLSLGLLAAVLHRMAWRALRNPPCG